jgi:hypothetical protein
MDPSAAMKSLPVSLRSSPARSDYQIELLNVSKNSFRMSSRNFPTMAVRVGKQYVFGVSKETRT